jgi:hydrogenase nickel incorporation protein HypA/HybF
MHEMALCESVLKILEEEAAKQRFDRVESVRLEVGRLSHVEPEAMRFCFEAVTRGTLADGARLEILRPAGEA